MLQGGALSYRLTDFVDYKIPTTSTPPLIGQYGIGALNTIPGMFGTDDADLRPYSSPAVRVKRVNLSVLPLGAAANPEGMVFTVRSGCPLAYPSSSISAAGDSRRAVTALWNQQATLVTPTVNPQFVRVATWDFSKMPIGAVPQCVSGGFEDQAVLGLVSFQVLNVNSDTQFFSSEGAFNMQFRVDVEFELPMPSLSQARTSWNVLEGSTNFPNFNPEARASDANCYIIVDGFKRTTSTLPYSSNVGH